MLRNEVSRRVRHVTPGQMTRSIKDSLGNRNLRKQSNFCHSASGELKIVVVSLSKVAIRWTGL